jgi:hypothetical protein
VNDHTLERQPLPQAGLPQGSPLSPALFLFFNAGLVYSRINSTGGSMAFVDDYSAWVTGPTTETNRAGIQAIIDRALVALDVCALLDLAISPGLALEALTKDNDNTGDYVLEELSPP